MFYSIAWLFSLLVMAHGEMVATVATYLSVVQFQSEMDPSMCLVVKEGYSAESGEAQ